MRGLKGLSVAPIMSTANGKLKTETENTDREMSSMTAPKEVILRTGSAYHLISTLAFPTVVRWHLYLINTLWCLLENIPKLAPLTYICQGKYQHTNGNQSQAVWTWHCLPTYCQLSNIRCTLVCNTLGDHSDVVGASTVCTAPTTSSFLT